MGLHPDQPHLKEELHTHTHTLFAMEYSSKNQKCFHQYNKLNQKQTPRALTYFSLSFSNKKDTPINPSTPQFIHMRHASYYSTLMCIHKDKVDSFCFPLILILDFDLSHAKCHSPNGQIKQWCVT